MADIYYNYASGNGQVIVSKPEDAAKIFVGGLSWDTTQEKLSSYFSQFGEVVDCILMMDTTTKRSRGFGFVTYKDPISVNRVLEGGPHVLDNKSIDPKAAVPRLNACNILKNSTNPSSPSVSRKCNKIFVGGIGQATEDDLRGYFNVFGNVTDVTIMIDKNTHRPRGFAFVGFETGESSEQTAQIRYHNIKGKRVEVKLAQPRDAKALDSLEDISKNDFENYTTKVDFDDSPDPTPPEFVEHTNGQEITEIKCAQLTDEYFARGTKNKIVRKSPKYIKNY